MNTDNHDWAKRARDAGVDGEFIMPEEQPRNFQTETDAYAAFANGPRFLLWGSVGVILGAVIAGALFG